MMNEVKLNLKGWGLVFVEIMWIEGNLYKIKFVPEDNILCDVKTEIFHVKEILNINEVFIDKNLKITTKGTNKDVPSFSELFIRYKYAFKKRCTFIN